ncbi:MAG: hypothetical protein R3B54_10630 [Bdellovibrionota bacterium]
MKLFTGEITSLPGFTVRPEGDALVALHYEYRIRTQSGEYAFVLEDVHYAEMDESRRKPGDYHFYRDARLGSKVRGSFSYWEKRQLNVIHAIHFS